MHWLQAIDLASLQVFVLTLARISGVVMLAPPLGGAGVPVRVRALLAVALALVVLPVAWTEGLALPATLPGYLVVIAGELLIGLALGLGILILFSGLQIAGQLIGTVGGMQAADIFSPGLDASVPLFSQVLYQFALAIFLVVGGHHLVLAGLLDTFVALPPGTGGVSEDLAGTLATLAGQSFALGVRVAAPVTASLLMATLVMGLISRTLPQLNILLVGFGVNAFVTFGVLALSLGSVAWVFADHIGPFIETVFEGLPARRGNGALF